MSFTTATITHQWTNADGTPSSGNVTFTLTKAITSGSVTIVPNHVIATLDNSGQISQPLVSNIDSSTIPQDSFWMVNERIMGAAERSYPIQVPSGGVAVDLGSLMPQVTPAEFG